MAEPKERTTTHGLGISFAGKDGVNRQVEMFRLDDGAVGFRFHAWWDGKDAEPLVTRLSLTVEAFNAMRSLITEFEHRRDDFFIPETKPQPE